MVSFTPVHFMNVLLFGIHFINLTDFGLLYVADFENPVSNLIWNSYSFHHLFHYV